MDPKKICCAAGVCCEDGSPEQLEALAAIYQEELSKHTGAAQAPGAAMAFARITLSLFKLESREPLPHEVLPEKSKDDEKPRRGRP